MNATKKNNKQTGTKQLLKDLIPLAKSFSLWIILVAIFAIDYTSNQWFSMVLIDFTTYTSYGLAKVLSIPAHLTGEGVDTVTSLNIAYQSISIYQFPMIIELECSAYHAYAAIISLVLFSKWQQRNKLIWGPIMLVLLALVNALRIVLLGVIGHKNPTLFNSMHDYIWNILLVIFIWIFWEFVNKRISIARNE